MIKGIKYFGTPAYLSLNNRQMVLRLPEVDKNDLLPTEFKKEAFRTFPIEDLGIVILDHKQITITQALMEALLENNTALVTCDSTHHPTGLMLPLCGNTIQNERFRAQLDASEPLKKQLWAQTISQKVRNQSELFVLMGLDNSYLVPIYRNVKSGDAGNSEAAAAAFYWANLFTKLPGPDGEVIVPAFKRFREGLPPNNYLNYGYALLRATMARSIVAAGLLPTLGIFHHNRYNAYCLADDLMEPYRPYVDKVVCNILKEHGASDGISKDIKAKLLAIPQMDVLMDGQKSPLMNATQRTAVSLVKCFNGEQRKLLYPEFM
jgi:CRISPR-associated protein Cas1